MKRIVNTIQVLMYNGQLHKVVLCTLVMVLMLTNSLHAQIEDPGGADGSDPDVPLDGGLSLLVATGVGYGAKKVKEKRTKGVL